MKLLANYANSSPISPTKIISKSVADLVGNPNLRKSYLLYLLEVGGWTNPFWKILLESKWVHLPQIFGMKMTKIFELPPASPYNGGKNDFLKPWQTEVLVVQKSIEVPRVTHRGSASLNGLPRNLGSIGSATGYLPIPGTPSVLFFLGNCTPKTQQLLP